MSKSTMAPGPVTLDVVGLELNAEDRRRILHPLTGGVILFGRNFVNRQQLTKLTAAIKKLRPDVLISIDHEGGRVQRAKSDGLAVAKLPDGQFFKFSDGGFNFRRLLGLAAGEVGGFEAAGVVFVLGLVLLVRGFGARGVRGAEINCQFVRQPGDDFPDEGAFVH